jgi:hypothetical protein
MTAATKLARDVRELDDTVAEGLGRDQLEFCCLEALEQTVATSDDDRKDRQAELFGEFVLEEHAVELTGTVLHDRLALLLLQPRHLCGRVALQDLGVPCRALKRRRGDELR